MKDGFIRVAAVTPKGRVADTIYNQERIVADMQEATREGAKVIVFPELCITGYSCGDLFLQETLLVAAKEALVEIVKESSSCDAIVFVGLPYEVDGKLYNMAAAIAKGKLLGMVPKSYLPNYNESCEPRYFTSGCGLDVTETFVDADGKAQEVRISCNQLFVCETMKNLRLAAELGDDLWAVEPPSIRHALAGASVIVNLSASNEVTGKSAYRQALVGGQSARLVCGYVHACAGESESTQDVVYSGHNLIAENGTILKESERFTTGIIYAELDMKRLEADRRRMTTYEIRRTHAQVSFSLMLEETELSRVVEQSPFVPSDTKERERRCEEILLIQAMGLKKRIEHTHCSHPVVGISGGLDSTLALLVMAKTLDLLGRDRKDIFAVTMPGFGTTDRTYQNACQMVNILGATLMEVPIAEAVKVHFQDIGHDISVHDVTYENAQARERTQILMDIANKHNGMVIGTGDMSELALGWATYNGDHMSMYGVNGSVPKTLVRHLVRYYADTCGDKVLSDVLYDVLDTPVSPELLPPEDGKISQKTEDIVGPYELHDFFMYYILRFGCTPTKIYRLAKKAFLDVYEPAFILKWLKTFYRRFFTQQFKRSCLPDGPKVGTVAVSPRGDLRMPSDACARLWLEEVENLE